MIEIIGIILLSIVAVIMIMAIIGYFMEKNQKKVANDSTSVVLQDNIKENANAATNANIPEVMNFNEISNEMNNEKVDAVINNAFITEEPTTDNMVNSNAATNANIPEVMNFNEISNDLENKEII